MNDLYKQQPTSRAQYMLFLSGSNLKWSSIGYNMICYVNEEDLDTIRAAALLDIVIVESVSISFT